MLQNDQKANPILRIRSKSPAAKEMNSPMSLRANFEDEAPSSDEELNCNTILEQSTRSIELNKVHNYTNV